MRRDPDIVRDILLAIEAAPVGKMLTNDDLDLPGSTPETVGEHVVLLEEAGFLEAHISRSMGGDGLVRFVVARLTWEGHDFLNTVRDADVWRETKKRVLEKGGSLSIELIKYVATNLLKQQLGLPG